MKKHFPFFSAAVFTAIISTFSCSSGGGGDTPSGGGSISSGTEDPALYCVIEALSYCVTGLSGKQCRDDGYRGNSGYSDTKCPSGYDIITKVGSSSSFGGQGGISSSGGSSSIVNIISSSSSIGVSSSSSSIGNAISSSSSIGVGSSSSSSIGNIVSSSSSAGVSVSSSSADCTATNNTETQYCSNGTMKEYGILTDSRSNPSQTYKTVVIGTQTWMAENLNYNVTNSKCYDDKLANCAKYGRLYYLNTVMNNSASSITNPSGVQGVCPAGWHLPSNAEWDVLVNYAGSSSTAGGKLKAIRGWDKDGNKSGDGTDNYGFSALPGGGGGSDGYFGRVGYAGYWWGAREGYYDNNYGRGITNNYDGIWWIGDNIESSTLYSVRCLKD